MKYFFFNQLSDAFIAKEEKESLLGKVRGFSGDVLKTIVLKLVEIGVEKPEQITKLIDMLSKL